ncbi:MAG TPA: Ig-like domain repeat protein [Candidatus Limnocylindrales bacterium]
MGPASVMAAPAITLTLVVSPTSAYLDDAVTATVTASPKVQGLQVLLKDSEGNYSQQNQTDANGQIVFNLPHTYPNYLWIGDHHLTATFAGDGFYAPATSNTVLLTYIVHPASMTYTYGDPWNDGVAYPYERTYIRVRVVVPVCGGGVTVLLYAGGGYSVAGSGGVGLKPIGNNVYVCEADIDVGYLSLGTHTFRIDYDGNWVNQQLESALYDVPVTLRSTTSSLAASVNPVEVNTQLKLTANAQTTDGSCCYVDSNGHFDFYDGTTLLGSVTAADNNGTSLYITPTVVGTHHYHAVWSGNALTYGSTSSDLDVSVTANVVHAVNLAISRTTFYPVVDGYYDTISISGYPEETVGVAVTIKNGSGTTVRSFSVPSTATPYSFVWDGKNGAGTLQAAGTYTVTQTLTDTDGAKLTWSSPVTLSLKKLVWYSASKTLYADQYSAKGTLGASIVTSPLYYRGRRISFTTGTPGRYAALGYQFTLPSAVKYSSLYFYVLGSGTHSATMSLHDWRLGSWASGSPWILDYFSPRASTGTSYAWHSVHGDSTYNRSGRTVQASVFGLNWTSGRYDISKVKLTYKYALLQ